MSQHGTKSEQPEAKIEAESKDANVLITSDGQILQQTITGTMNIDTGENKNKNKNRFASMKFAVAGLLYLLKHEQSIQLASVATVVVLLIGFWIDLGTYSWATLTLALGIIWITEALNSAIEASINLSASQPEAWAKIGKDVASAASLIATIIFVIIVALILVPPILRALNAG